jgi:hypothetical protein
MSREMRPDPRCGLLVTAVCSWRPRPEEAQLLLARLVWPDGVPDPWLVDEWVRSQPCPTHAPNV